MTCDIPMCKNPVTHEILAESKVTKEQTVMFVCKDHFYQLASTMRKDEKELAK